MVESDEDGTEERSELFVEIGLEIQLDIDDEGGADSREQTSLQEEVGSLAK